MNAPVNKPPETASFLNLPVVSNWHGLDADAIIFGAPFGKPYRPADFPNDQSSAPAALRAASGRVLLNEQALDIDFTTPACFGNLRVVDGGDVPLINDDFDRHYRDIEQAVRFAIARDILPVTVGGDDGVTNPVLRGLDGLSNITLIQIDAHLDWRDERCGERDGFSSPMRRASELRQITAIHQIGIRSFGSAEQNEWDEAMRWGAQIHPARDIFRHGMGPVIDALPAAGRFFVTLDVDGLDPSVMPATTALAPGGLIWWHVIDLFEGLARKGDIVGLNIVELAPKNDVNQLSMIVTGRLLVKLLMLQLQKGGA